MKATFVIQINEKELTKLYYSIGEVAEMFDVNTSLIRFWEKEFKSIKPKKNKKGNRLFTAKDILKVEQIYRLVKVKGFTLDGARNELKKQKSVSVPEEIHLSENNDLLVNRLSTIKEKLLKMKNSS